MLTKQGIAGSSGSAAAAPCQVTILNGKAYIAVISSAFTTGTEIEITARQVGSPSAA